MKRRGRPPHPDILTPREWEVLELLRAGLSNPEIAERLGVTRDAVKYHVSEILSKLAVTSREEAAVWRPYKRPWWVATITALAGMAGRLSPLGRIGAVGASVVALGGLALLAWGVLATSGEDGGPRDGVEDGNAARVSAEAPASVDASQERIALGKIAHTRDGNLWVVDLDTGEERLLREDGVLHTPKWSPFGDWIAYGSGSFAGGAGVGLAVVPQEGGDFNPIAAPVAFWEWSPVDNLLAYQMTNDNSIWIYDPATGEKTQIAGPHPFRTPPVWLGDFFIAYGSASHSLGDPPLPGVGTVEIYDLAAPRTIPVLAMQDSLVVPRVHSFSPQDNWLLYWNTSISASANADGAALSATRPLEFGKTDVAIATTLIYPESATWSPLGVRAAIVEGGGRELWFGKDILLITPGISNEVRIARSGFAEFDPAWIAETLAFARLPEQGDDNGQILSRGRIWTALADGSRDVQLTDDERYSDRKPEWSIDGSHILFVRLSVAEIGGSDEAPTELWTMRFDGSDQRKLANLGSIPWFGYYGHTDWSQTFDWHQPRFLEQAVFEEFRQAFQVLGPYPGVGVIYLDWSGAPPLVGTFRTADPPETVIDYYADALPSQGWQAEGEPTFVPGDPSAEKPTYPQYSLAFVKETLRLTVVAASNPEKDPSLPTAVSLTLGKR